MELRKSSALIVLVLALSASVVCFSLPYKTNAEVAGPDWINGAITVSKDSDYAWKGGDETIYGNNRTCENISAYSWTWHNNGWTRWLEESKQVDCATMGASAYFGYRRVLPFGSGYWQQLNVSNYYNPTIYPNPGTDGIAMLTNSYATYANGPHELYYTPNALSLFSVMTKDGTGNVIRSPKSQFENKLVYADGTPVSVTGSSGINYSANGQWMFVNVNGVGQMRVSTKDMSGFSFAPAYAGTYSLFDAVSNSGNTVATHAYSVGLKLYDLMRCGSEKPKYGSRDCAVRDLTQKLREGIIATLDDPSKLGWVDVKEIRFASESRLKVLVSYVYGGQGKYAFLTISTSTSSQSVRYLALGDSFSSGEGAGSYYGATNFYADAGNFNLCHQSKVAYSELLNKWLTPDWYDSAACSGAVMKDVVYGGGLDELKYYREGSQAKSSQIVNYDDALARDGLKYFADNLRPGYVPQQSILSAHSPTVSTITIGGNDIGFGQIVQDCVLQPGCYSSRDDRERFADLIDSKIPYLEMTYKSILTNMAGENPKLYVAGYPRLFNPYTTCGSFMKGTEREFANNLVDYLNDAVRIAAKRAGAVYVNVSDAFVDSINDLDYRLCGNTQPAANGLTIDIPGSSDGQPLEKYLSQSYHPNALGNSLLAGRIRMTTNDFGRPMPLKNVTETKPNSTLYSALVGDTGSKFDSEVNFGEITGQYVFYEDQSSVAISHTPTEQDGIPAAGTTVTVTVQSDPVVIGQLTVGTDKRIATATNAPLQLPAGLHYGLHRLHLLYKDIQGRNRDIVQYIYVFANQDDLDGDGIPNSQEKCAIGGTMGIDYDQDDVDDACDGDVTEKPVTPTPTPAPTEPPVDPAPDPTPITTPETPTQSQDQEQASEVTATTLPSGQGSQVVVQQPQTQSALLPSSQTPERQNYVLGENLQAAPSASTPTRDGQQKTKPSQAKNSKSIVEYWPYLLIVPVTISGIVIAFKRLKT